MALSPMMQNYLEIKEEYKDCILLFRLGDFYEMFFDDAQLVSKELDLTLTGRDCGLTERAPMCGIPHHAAENYIARLINKGFKVAICEQLNTPEDTKGMLERGVTRVITPGTVIEDDILDEKKNNYIASVFSSNNGIGISWADVSTGECNLLELPEDTKLLQEFLFSIHPAEIISSPELAVKSKSFTYVSNNHLPRFYSYFDWAFAYDYAVKTVLKQLGVISLDSFECTDRKNAICSAGALFEYLNETQKRAMSHITTIRFVNASQYMLIDNNTKRNLELTENSRDNKKYGSLIWVLDKTETNMGARNIRKWIEQPLQDETLINKRLAGVEEIYKSNILRDELKQSLGGIRDIERITSKIVYGSINPRDCLSLKESLGKLPDIKEILCKCKADMLIDILGRIDPLEDLYELIDKAIDPEAAAVMKDGGYIKNGYNSELDTYRSARTEGKNWLASLEAKEREATGIKTLKVGYNKVFGYYIEITNSYLNMVPYSYQRKQTLTNGERFITEDLKKIEDIILSAEEKGQKLEQSLFSEIREQLLEVVRSLQITSLAVAELDSLYSFASVAANNNYYKPVINSKVNSISIKNGRHPAVEELLKENDFIANDTFIDNKDNRVMIITGPNMAGKSTYMRQVALITLMAHIGSFVPAEQAEISITDRIFTRVGASDDLIFGHSTFMVEMIEVATIINNATAKSLLILDEIGRGTSTFDGLSIAWAVMEYICNVLHAKCLFATHYHELTELEGILAGVKNYRILCKETGDTIIFLYKIARGGAMRSFGIEVAALAGVNPKIVARAKEILARLEASDINRDTNSIMLKSLGHGKSKQISLFDNSGKESEIINILKDTDINGCTPMQALTILQSLVERAKK